jgi:hypothetical protein
MLVSLVWPDCTYRNGEWHHEEMPSFWVGVTAEEVDVVGPALDVDLDMELADQEGSVFLLVSRDLSSVTQHPSWYPMSGQWVAGSPFQPVDPPVTVNTLGEVAELEL